jgi:hypothetical protein
MVSPMATPMANEAADRVPAVVTRTGRRRQFSEEDKRLIVEDRASRCRRLCCFSTVLLPAFASAEVHRSYAAKREFQREHRTPRPGEPAAPAPAMSKIRLPAAGQIRSPISNGRQSRPREPTTVGAETLPSLERARPGHDVEGYPRARRESFGVAAVSLLSSVPSSFRSA